MNTWEVANESWLLAGGNRERASWTGNWHVAKASGNGRVDAIRLLTAMGRLAAGGHYL